MLIYTISVSKCRESHLRALSSNPPECQDWGKGGGVKPILAMPGFWERLLRPPLPKYVSRALFDMILRESMSGVYPCLRGGVHVQWHSVCKYTYIRACVYAYTRIYEYTHVQRHAASRLHWRHSAASFRPFIAKSRLEPHLTICTECAVQLLLQQLKRSASQIESQQWESSFILH